MKKDDCPVLKKIMEEAFSSDQDAINQLQRVFGRNIMFPPIFNFPEKCGWSKIHKDVESKTVEELRDKIIDVVKDYPLWALEHVMSNLFAQLNQHFKSQLREIIAGYILSPGFNVPKDQAPPDNRGE